MEVLPKHMVHLADPRPESLIEQLEIAIPNSKNIPAQAFHNQVSSMYNWMNVAKRTVRAELEADKRKIDCFSAGESV